jgi:hypothetical protein
MLEHRTAEQIAKLPACLPKQDAPRRWHDFGFCSFVKDVQGMR